MLAVIPARGGSKAIKRKNLRVIAGRPLLGHKIAALRLVPEITRLVVTTDDKEIAGYCKAHGIEVLDRPAALAQDDTPVAQAVLHAVETLKWEGEVGVFQPTSPTLKPQTISRAIAEHRTSHAATTIAVTPDSHLMWDDHGPLYERRENRQLLDPMYRETGGFFLCSWVPVGPMDPLVGHPTRLFQVPADEAVDVDGPADLEAARRVLARRHVEFRYVASNEVGSGHLHRCLALADELDHEVTFRFRPGLADWSFTAIEARGYQMEPADADLVVFDVLDTDCEEVAKVRASGARVVTLEDEGDGRVYSDLTINELYRPAREIGLSHVEYGPKWAVLRPEFIDPPPFKVRDGKGLRTLVAFGGTDPAGLSKRVGGIAAREGESRVLLGPASKEFSWPGVELVRGNVAAEMLAADLVVCSAGRTANEAAALGVPCLTIAANERETRHAHANGVHSLGLHISLSDDAIQEAIKQVLHSESLRREMSVTSKAAIDGLGSTRIARRIDDLLAGL